MKTFATITLTILFVAAALSLATRPAAAAPHQPQATIRVTSVSALDTKNNGWTVSLSNGATMFVELRAFDTQGQSPSIGVISNFSDQGWFPILGYYGYATFVQNGVTYHALR